MAIKDWFMVSPKIVKTFRVGYSVIKVLSDDTIWEYNIGPEIPILSRRWRLLE